MKALSEDIKEAKEIKKKMDELEFKKDLVEKRSKITNFDELIEFLKYVKDNCNRGYGEAPRAIAQAALAVAWQLASEFGITGFQAGYVMFDFIRDWQYRGNKSGLKIVDYDKMLYPQYEYDFEKTIKGYTWSALQSEAQRLLEEDNEKEDEAKANPKVREHWESIVAGNVPFGYSVSEDK